MNFLKNKKIIKYSLLFVFCVAFLLMGHMFGKTAYSDEYDDLTKKIADLQTALSESQNATKPLQTQLTSLKTQLANIDAQISQIEADLVIKKKNIDEGYKNLADKQKVFNVTVKNSYIKTYTFSPLLVFLSGNNISDISNMLTYQKRDTEQDKNLITNIALQLVDLERKKADLESSQQRLAVAKASLDKDRAAIQKVVDGAVAYQSSLTGQIAVLSARQQQILSQRLGALNIPLYANSGGACSSDLTNGKDPGISGTKFGFFTYGVPNRVGLNQYGAFGRAKAGQSYDTILHAYYNFDSIENRSATINVDGYGSYSLEDYVKRIYEVPDEWGSEGGMEALKAQAIAARSYALSYTNNGSGSICTTQQCQVFKPDPKGGNWEQAVNATAGQVMVQGGNPIKAWFSSTHGGYVHSSGDIGWDSTGWTKNAQDTSGSVSNFSDLNNNSYDKDSPWFYCDWGSRPEYNNTAWLKPDEVADIANVVMLASRDPSTKEHLYQPDKPNLAGTDTWDPGRVRQELSSRGGSPLTSVDNVSVSWDTGSGKTTQVTIDGQSFNANDFKTYFNLRAPGTIQIVGPLFNVEKR
jgi:peptidoglycan hydrolase CwlO-like protein